MRFVRWFSDVGLPDVGLVGGKNASLGELIRSLSPLGVRVPDGFAITAEAYRHFLREAGVEEPVRQLIGGLRRDDVQDLVERSARIRALIVSADLPGELREEARAAYRSCPEDTQWTRPTSRSAPRPRRRTCRAPASPDSKTRTSTCGARRPFSTPCGAASPASSPPAPSGTARTWGSTIWRSRSPSACRRWSGRTWRPPA